MRELNKSIYFNKSKNILTNCDQCRQHGRKNSGSPKWLKTLA